MHEILSKIVGAKNVLINEPMNRHTTFKIGGPAEYFVVVNSIDELIKVIEVSKNKSIPLHIIGNGSNLLVSDEGVKGVVIKLGINNMAILHEENDASIVEVEAGISNAAVAKFLEEHSLSGFEFAQGIPGTIGGSIRMNAGAFGGEIKDAIVDVTLIDIKTLNIKTLTNDALNFKYRYSMFIDNKNYIILSARFKFKRGNREDIKRKMLEISSERKSKQPIDKPSAGSTFRRLEGFITAKAIDEEGLMGTKIGGAMVSTKHAGFIINDGNATAKDVLELIKLIQNKIYELHGVRIEPELEIWE